MSSCLVGWRRAVSVLALWSAGQLVPPTLVAQDDDALTSLLEGAFDGSAWASATWGVMVVSLDSGDTLFAIQPDSALSPASNLKLLTTAAALRSLGAEHRFRTYLLTDGDIDRGVLRGDLVLYGTGDPGIGDRFHRTKDAVFDRLIDQLEARGIHTVTGDLVGDASFLPGPLRPEGWEPRDLDDHFTAAVSALSFNENVLSFRVVPGPVGQPPGVSTVPDDAGVEFVNNATTVPGNGRPRLAILRDSPLDIVRVEGELSRGSRDQWRQITVPSPAHFTASAFRAALQRRGIALQGGLRVVEGADASVVGRFSAPAFGRRGARVLARHVSAPLSTYLEVINKESHNLFAELVFRTLGRVSEGVGSPEASARAVLAQLSALGVDVRDVRQLDGSGLSAGNRVSAATFVDVLERMAASPDWPDFWASLPEAGNRRGLRRMYRTAAAGNLRAKTGTIEGVSALSGMVRSGDGERLAFSLLVNGARSQNRAKRLENRVGAMLASFQRSDPSTIPLRRVEAQASTRVAEVDEQGRHRVRTGENLSAIASRYGVSLRALIRANPRVEPDRVVAGQWLEIPQRGSSD